MERKTLYIIGGGVCVIIASALVWVSLKKKGKARSSHQAIYLDYNSTTPVDPKVRRSMLAYLGDKFGNPSNSHEYGVQAQKGVQRAKRKIAELINAHEDEIFFTSCATESINWALKGVALGNLTPDRPAERIHIITGATEHVAVLEVCNYLQHKKFRVTKLGVDQYGQISPSELVDAVQEDTVLISLMFANNETGTLHKIKELIRAVKQRNSAIIFHTDASQAVGKVFIDVKDLNVDLLTIAGHKIYAPKGIGALYIRGGLESIKSKEIPLEKFMHGAGHEHGLRAGTESVPLIVGLGKACEIAQEGLDRDIQHLESSRLLLQQKLETFLHELVVKSGLATSVSEIMRVNGHPTQRLPNTLNISFALPEIEGKDAKVRSIKGDEFLKEIQHVVAASAGAACHSGEIKVSHVLEAMNVPKKFAGGTIRLSVGRMTTEKEIERAAWAVAIQYAKIARAQS